MHKYREMANRSQQAVLSRLGKGPKPSAGMAEHGQARVGGAFKPGSRGLDHGIAPVAGKEPKNRMDKLARGGAVKLKHGGHAKGHTKVNIMIAPQGAPQAPQRVPVPVPVPAGGGAPPPMARPPMPPPAAPMGGAPGMAGAGGPPPLGAVRKMGGHAHRKHGGRTLDGATTGPTMQEVRSEQSKRSDLVTGHRACGGRAEGGEVEHEKHGGRAKHRAAGGQVEPAKPKMPGMKAGAGTGVARLAKAERMKHDGHKAPAVAG